MQQQITKCHFSPNLPWKLPVLNLLKECVLILPENKIMENRFETKIHAESQSSATVLDAASSHWHFADSPHVQLFFSAEMPHQHPLFCCSARVYTPTSYTSPNLGCPTLYSHRVLGKRLADSLKELRLCEGRVRTLILQAPRQAKDESAGGCPTWHFHLA